MTFPRVSRRGCHFANVGDVIIYPDLVLTRTVYGHANKAFGVVVVISLSVSVGSFSE